jgi:predicted Zn-dependent peptidase
MPERGTPEYYAMGLLDQILLQGDDSLLRQELVKKRALTGTVEGGINLLGNMFNYNGPMLWMGYLFYDTSTSQDQILHAIDSVLDPVRENGVTVAALDRARIKLRSDFYDSIDSGFGRSDLLASFALFDDRPQRINDIEQQFDAVTPELVKKAAAEYLRPTNRTVLQVVPAPAATAQKGAN